MDNFRIIYRVLKNLEQAMDCEEFDRGRISPEALKISEPRWYSLMEMLADEGYIRGMQITLKGLEYLHGSPFMKEYTC